MIILGINAYHGDSSAVIIVDGKLIVAIEEERILRIKHWAGFPTESIKWCLSCASLGIEDIDYVTISRNPWALMHRKVLRIPLYLGNLSFFKGRVQNYAKLGNIKRKLADIYHIEHAKLKLKVVNIEHHRSHIASGFFVSPFKKAAVASIDSFGDFSSLMTGVGDRNRIRITNRVEFPHSLGLLYTAMTQYLGFCNYGDEYKVMGLSAKGKPKYQDLFNKIVRIKNNRLFELDTNYFLHVSQGVNMSWDNTKPFIQKLFSSQMESLLGPARQKGEELSKRFQNIAASTQQTYEDVFFHILNNLYEKTRLSNLVLTGGCAQNSLANGKIYERTKFKNIYIPPAANDAGGAIGAAFYLLNHKLGQSRSFVMDSPFWGPKFEMKDIRAELERRNLSYTELRYDELIRKIAEEIASGKVVGWFQGRSEWGPRALGNRSILADPRRKDMKDILNLRIKKREDFRPFAPSILVEKTGEWFEENQPVPFMEKVYKMKEDKRALVPAIINIDGTGRLQTVSRVSNQKYYDLIKEFEKITSVPLILNTSFNDNEPIVNTPADALDCFTNTKIDCLVLENFYIVQT